MTVEEKRAYDLVCEQLRNTMDRVEQLEAAIKRAVGHEVECCDCPSTVKTLVSVMEIR